MKIKSIELWNIRSYEHERIVFNNGITLLSGDIGSGKSTILKAIEFALFGISKNEGASLLRHGKTKGRVRLELEINGKEIIIERSLKRNKNIQQDKGLITINGIEEESSPTELKSRIFELMGYPKNILAKKDLLFKYTVYTPQEEMKRIIEEKAENRLEILRKLFGIEKYSRVKENINQLLRKIKQDIQILVEKAGKEEELKDKELELGERITELRREAEERKKQKSEIEEKIKVIEEKLIELNEKYLKQKKLEMDWKNKNEEIKRVRKEIKSFEEELKRLISKKEEITIKEIEDPSKDIELLKQELVEIDKKLRGLIREIAVIEEKISNTRESINNIINLDICPTCKQKVDKEHKERISIEYNSKIEEFLTSKEEKKKQKEELEEKKREIEKRIEEKEVIRRKYILMKEKKKMLEEFSRQIVLIERKINEYKERETTLEKEIREIENIEINKEIDKEINQLRQELDVERKREKAILTRISSITTEINVIEKQLMEINKEIKEIEKYKKEKEIYEKIYNWLKKFFLPLIENIEINVLASIHSVFNDLFNEWFIKLVGSEEINARLDKDFTPIIEEQGYDTSINALSGGERTSVALAYRLALNSVLNTMIQDINTKDLIILDEPTEGFSSEQIERMGELLRTLRINQIILVSHEQQLEGFVDNVIRIKKENGVSTINSF